jgi:capsular exopolysaccharide synthesis family protein
VSKIYDALRKAERDRGRSRVAADRADEAPPSRLRGESVLRAGMDERYHRSLLNLKNAIDSGMKGRESRVILFTSAIGGEGKTSIVSSLARVIALGESSRVLLVDCSARDPQLHRLFGLKNERGLVDFLAGNAKLKDVMQTIDQGALDIVTAGAIGDIEAPQTLFGSERFALFIKEAAAAYEYVLIDSSAILESPETPIIGSRADGIVMVVHAGKTRREVIKRAMLMIEKLDGAFIGTVLNRKRYYIPEFIYRRV